MGVTNIKICLISSHGGHFHELINATKGVEGNIYWVTFKSKHTLILLKDKPHYFLIDPVVSIWKYILNAFQSFNHLRIEKPKVIISTGAGIAIPTILIAKIFLRAKVIYIESAAAVNKPSRTGRFIYRFADLFIIQWEDLLCFYPEAVYKGLL
jgi:UDP-N-acetylglucosamine:LPS N-acetylglucosamine transferase